jgi:hypothetical protein
VVTAVTRASEPGLPQKNQETQGGSPGNPGNLEFAALSDRLDANDPAAWCSLFKTRIGYRLTSAVRARAEAETLAFEDCVLQWHRRHGAKQDPNRCAGCGDLFHDNDALDLGRGARVHFDARLLCLTRYGQAWRSAAVCGLHALGIDPPTGFELL